MTEDPDAGLSQFMGYNMKRALSVVQADLTPVLAEFGLRAVSYSALLVIVRTPGISQSDLADALHIEKSNLVQLIDDLAQRGLVTRSAVPGDRRRHALIPAEAGIALAKVATSAVQAHEDRVFAALSMVERATLVHLLRRVWAMPRRS